MHKTLKHKSVSNCFQWNREKVVSFNNGAGKQLSFKKKQICPKRNNSYGSNLLNCYSLMIEFGTIQKYYMKMILKLLEVIQKVPNGKIEILAFPTLYLTASHSSANASLCQATF